MMCENHTTVHGLSILTLIVFAHGYRLCTRRYPCANTIRSTLNLIVFEHGYRMYGCMETWMFKLFMATPSFLIGLILSQILGNAQTVLMNQIRYTFNSRQYNMKLIMGRGRTQVLRYNTGTAIYQNTVSSTQY